MRRRNLVPRLLDLGGHFGEHRGGRLNLSRDGGGIFQHPKARPRAGENVRFGGAVGAHKGRFGGAYIALHLGGELRRHRVTGPRDGIKMVAPGERTGQGIGERGHCGNSARGSVVRAASAPCQCATTSA